MVPDNLFYQINAHSFNVHDGRSIQLVTIYRPTVTQEIEGEQLH